MTRSRLLIAVVSTWGVFATVATTGGCRRPIATASQISEIDEQVASEDQTDGLKQSLVAEVLEGYDRGNDPFSSDLGDYYGIGVGPGDLWSAPESFVMPLADVGRGFSNRFGHSMSAAGTSAWVFDEVSWRVDVCGRSLPVPLRYSAVLRRDGERWFPLMQHVSIAVRDMAGMDAIKIDAAKAAVADRTGPERDMLPAEGGPILALAQHTSATMQTIGPLADPAPFMAPAAAEALFGLLVSGRIIEGTSQSAFVKPSGKDDVGAVGYWAGVVAVDSATAQRVFAGQEVAPVSTPSAAAGELLLRVTIVLHQSQREWLPVHAHVSAAIGYEHLVARMFGSQVAQASPLEFVCD